MDWDKLKIFHAVAEAGNFTKATYILNLSQSAISRQIQSLEKELKTQLFERHARGLSLTDNGEYLFKTAHEVISKLKDVEATLSDEKDKLHLKLRKLEQSINLKNITIRKKKRKLWHIQYTIEDADKTLQKIKLWEKNPTLAMKLWNKEKKREEQKKQ